MPSPDSGIVGGPARYPVPVLETRRTGVVGDTLTFWFDDPEHAASRVRLWYHYDLDLPREFTQVAGGWALTVPRPPLDRFEYLLEIGRDEGGQHFEVLTVDPSNPHRVGGAFGDHSWLPLPGYRTPDWLDEPSIAHHRALATLATPVGEVGVIVWSPADASFGELLPLLLAHDGPEYDRFAGLTQFIGAGIAAGRLPRMRVALLDPGARNTRYSANPGYACALVDHVLPWLVAAHPTPVRPVLMGASLGGLAAFHAEWTHPGTFAGLALQSGSFFTPSTDAQEVRFKHFGDITRFVGEVQERSTPSRPAVSVTCGSAEENLRNNRLLAERLAGEGVPVAWGEVRDGHNFSCWRDLFDPHLTTLLREAWN